jgi:hypothetical protein
MNNRIVLAILAATCAVCSAPAQPPKKKLLFIGEVRGFQHDSVSHEPGASIPGSVSVWKTSGVSALRISLKL